MKLVQVIIQREDDCDNDPGDELDELDLTFVLRVEVSLPLPKAEATGDT